MEKITQLNIEPVSFKHAQECLLMHVDNLTLSVPGFSTRSAFYASQEEISKLCKAKANTKIWVKVNAFIQEEQIPDLTNYLVWLEQQNIDYLIFQDYAIAQIIYEKKLPLKLHYNPDTLVTNYGQFDFFQDNHFSGCFLARELILSEVLQIASNKQNLKLEIQAFGYGFIMHSRWKLISNFESFYQTNISQSKEYISIKENLRKIPNLIYEDEHGTHMFTGYIISIFSVLDQLVNVVDYLQLNFLMINKDLAAPIISLYINALEEIKHGTYISTNYVNKLATILVGKTISAGFLGGTKDILHLLKDEHE